MLIPPLIHILLCPPSSDYPDYGNSYYNNFPMKEEDERLAKNGTKYEEEEEEPNNEIDY